ncbi:hypothetical protein AB0I16_26220 [Streptomyces sp. NPDC050703]|uniref:hypothetical protein n=1 Tax=Streptomyces sp. NPDC050703 TaxID=3157218 RepID=UPI003432774E
MTAGTATAATARSMDGPFVARRCVRSGSGYRWFEQAVAPGDYLDATRLRRLAGLVPASGGAVAALPGLVRPDLAAWPVMPTPALLCDDLFGAPARAGADRWASACEDLGAFLGRVHRVPAAEAEFLPVRGHAAWLPPGAARTDRVDAARAGLAGFGDGVLASAAASAGAPPRPDSLVHGRFSSGLVVPLARPVVQGWREAGVGDPDRDIAFFLAELVESAAVGTGGGRFPVLVRAFLTGYAGAGDGPGPDRLPAQVADRLPALVADRLLEHYAQAAVRTGSADRLEQVVAGVTARWRELVDLIEDGGR